MNVGLPIIHRMLTAKTLISDRHLIKRERGEGEGERGRGSKQFTIILTS